MSDTTNTDLGLDSGDIDDVEGHGLKELAIGLGAAGIVATGATSAMAMSAPGTGPEVDRATSTVQQMSDRTQADLTALRGSAEGTVNTWAADPMGQGDRTVDSGLNTIRSERNNALRTTNATVKTTVDAADAALKAAGETLDGARELGDRTINDTSGTAQSTLTSLRTAADGTVVTAQRIADQGLGTARDLTRNSGVTATVGADGVTITAQAGDLEVEIHKG